MAKDESMEPNSIGNYISHRTFGDHDMNEPVHIIVVTLEACEVTECNSCKKGHEVKVILPIA